MMNVMVWCFGRHTHKFVTTLILVRFILVLVLTDAVFTFKVLLWSFFCNPIDKFPCTESGFLGCEVHLNGATVVFIPYECTWTHRYNKLCGMVTKLVSIIKKLDPKDPFRIEMTETLLEKL